MENCNHNYKDGKKCWKCGHIRPDNSKTPRYKQEKMIREAMAQAINEIPILRTLNNAIERMKY